MKPPNKAFNKLANNCKFFLILSFCFFTLANTASAQNTLLVGPEPLNLTDELSLESEYIVISGDIITNGHKLDIVARVLEFKDNAQIVAFRTPAPDNLNIKHKKDPPQVAEKQKKGTNGADGEKGFKGYPGCPKPSPINITAGFVIGKINIDGSGQTGGKGGRGQDAQDGGKGGAGRAAQAVGVKLWFRKGPGRGSTGGQGGCGGTGGDGGNGGPATEINLAFGDLYQRGSNGELKLIDDPVCEISKTVVSSGGLGGLPGEPGINGKPGEGGAGGKSAVILWKTSGNGKKGRSGPTNTRVASIGDHGACNNYTGNINISQDLKYLNENFAKAHSLVKAALSAERALRLVQELSVTNLDQAKTLNKIKQAISEFRFYNLKTLSVQESQMISDVEKYLETYNNTQQNYPPRFLETVEHILTKFSNQQITGSIAELQSLTKKIKHIHDTDTAKFTKNLAHNVFKLYGPQILDNWLKIADHIETAHNIASDPLTTIIRGKDNQQIKLYEQPPQNKFIDESKDEVQKNGFY